MRMLTFIFAILVSLSAHASEEGIVQLDQGMKETIHNAIWDTMYISDEGYEYSLVRLLEGTIEIVEQSYQALTIELKAYGTETSSEKEDEHSCTVWLNQSDGGQWFAEAAECELSDKD